jgi:imidazolonepropionase-like amidohydrolase
MPTSRTQQRHSTALALQIATIALVLTACVGTGAAPQPELTAYVNGHVFDGERFRMVPLVVGDGRFVEASAAHASQTVDLQGMYVVPPFCEAHNHNLGDADENKVTIERYLREGIFYVGILSNLPALTDPVRNSYNTPTSVDVVFANGPLTATGGHPIRLREFLLERGAYPGFTRETLPGQGYFVVNDEADLERQWPAIVGLRPDFIKIVLIFSEEFARRRDDPAFFGLKGLDPALVPLIVERAHAEGLRVFAHVETGHDFHVGVQAGVDVIAHLPGYLYPTAIDPADGRLAAERGVIVMTTTVLIERPNRASQRDALREAQIANLRLLRQAGVTLVAGSDEHEETSTAEIAHLREMGVFGNAELLRMWSTDCARTLFPRRRVGGLTPGDEASFLVLGGDPLSNFDATRDIRMRVKEGVTIDRLQDVPDGGG